MKRSQWGNTPPPQAQDLGNGITRVYLNVTAATETNIFRDEEDNLRENTTDVYFADELDIEGAPTYEKVVEALIADRYSLAQEVAIQRQKDSKPEEFAAYNEYAEECKKLAKRITY